MLPAVLVFACVYLSSATPDYIHFDDADTSCTTCVPIEQCAAARRALAARTTATTNFLRDHGCGFRANEPLVCCDEFKTEFDKSPAISSHDSTKRMIIGSRNTMVSMDSAPNDDNFFNQYFDSYEDTYTHTNHEEMEKPIHRHYYNQDGYNQNNYDNGDKYHSGNHHDALDGFYYGHSNGFHHYEPHQFHGHSHGSHRYPAKPSHGLFPERPQWRPSTTTSANSLDSSEEAEATWIDVESSPNVGTPRPEVARGADEQLNAPRCGSSVQSRIVGGLTANDGQFPWVARLGYRKRGLLIEEPMADGWPTLNFRCGATLVTSRHVLTAAHCLVRLPSNTYLSVVRVGSGKSSRDYAPLRTVSHASYDTPRLRHDIGIVQLNETVKFNGNVNTICLPFAPHDLDLSRLLRERSSLVVAGWGTTTVDSTANSLTLQWARVSLMQQKSCAGAYLATYNVSVGSEQLCAEPLRGVDACGGDSGGPLFRDVEAAGTEGVGSLGRRAVLVGLVSFGPRRCGSPERPGVYTNVAAYTAWIRENLNAT